MRATNDDGLGARLATAHAADLLAMAGVDAAPDVAADHPALAWRRAGLLDVTGRADGPGLVAPLALASAADGALGALKAIAPPGADLPDRGALLLGERARLRGLTRAGAISANGTCRLLAAGDGTVALSLPRPDDWDLLPALFGEPAEDWAAVARILAGRPRGEIVARGRLLGLAVAEESGTCRAPPFVVERLGPARRTGGRPLVVDLSALWAGPLAGSLLRAMGARVVKVESRRRPDGARGGHAGFFDLLNAGKRSVVLDFADPADIRRLRDLVDAADIVIDSARPRALAALSIDAGAVAARGAVWVAITAHGRVGEAANHVGFGDDTAVAGGVSAAMARAWGGSLFAGDAIADPLTGIVAALAAWAAWRRGGRRLVSVALVDVVAHAARLHEVDDRGVRAWQAIAEADTASLYPLRRPGGGAGGRAALDLDAAG